MRSLRCGLSIRYTGWTDKNLCRPGWSRRSRAGSVSFLTLAGLLGDGMRSNLAGPRLLLRRLREVMAEPIKAQERLDKIVVLIASNVVAEVCSVYILRADGVLELYATEGLKREAVHNASLRVGEGLVGLIAAEARPAQSPQCQCPSRLRLSAGNGEEAYNSFLGVPILRAGRTLGVLVVQNQSHRTYLEDEVEALQTTAMVIAEMVAAGELEAISQKAPGLDLSRPIASPGVGLAEGVGWGTWFCMSRELLSPT
jgi:phosphotransferase system enzyme I (PtsP)